MKNLSPRVLATVAGGAFTLGGNICATYTGCGQHACSNNATCGQATCAVQFEW